jgi:amidophosphoribosyltransferase
MLFGDRIGEECGVFGIFGNPEAANLTYLGLFALQHRGQESTGIVSSDGKDLFVYKRMGLVSEVFNEKSLQVFKGHFAIGHVRYSTAGSSTQKNAQPIMVEYSKGPIAVAHNGNFVNTKQIRHILEEMGSIFQTDSDTEILVHLIARSKKKDFEDTVVDALNQLNGAFSLLLITPKVFIAIRDPRGFRPLSLGKMENSYVIASETCAFDLIGAEFVRDIQPGEMVVITEDGFRSYFPFPKSDYSFCIFEHIYFSRPDSNVFGKNAHMFRREFGRRLALREKHSADLIIPVPDSGSCAATGFAELMGLSLQKGLVRNHYIGRTFIEPKQSIRHFGAKIKHNPIKNLIQGNELFVVDDSIVRGTTCRKIVMMLRAAGAKKVHMRIPSPPFKFPCFYGVDIPSRDQLIAANHSIEEIREYITADSLEYLTVEELLLPYQSEDSNYCHACLSGKYPTKVSFDIEAQMDIFNNEFGENMLDLMKQIKV